MNWPFIHMTAQSARISKEEVLAAYRRTELLAAARRVFGGAGFEAATMDAIADEAKVAKGTIYLYFPSKQAIYDATFQDGMDELQRLSAAQVAAAGNLKDAIRAFVHARVSFFQGNPDYYRIYITEKTRHLTGQLPRRNPCRSTLESQTRELEEVFERAIASGEVRAVDPVAAATAVFDITRGMIGRRLLSGATTNEEDDIDFITDLIWSGLQPRPAGQGTPS
jgi:AcrR family transcriptional regulator